MCLLHDVASGYGYIPALYPFCKEKSKPDENQNTQVGERSCWWRTVFVVFAWEWRREEDENESDKFLLMYRGVDPADFAAHAMSLPCISIEATGL